MKNRFRTTSSRILIMIMAAVIIDFSFVIVSKYIIKQILDAKLLLYKTELELVVKTIPLSMDEYQSNLLLSILETMEK